MTSGITIGSNILSLKAQRQLSRSSDAVSEIYERLSSGSRINKASDDAAGLSIANYLDAQSKQYTVALRNTNDGISMLSIAQGALSQLSSIATRQTELAEQAANGAYANTQRAALHNEAQSLSEEWNRIVKSTTFNGIGLFAGDSGIPSVSLQVGVTSSSDSQITTSIGGGLARTVGTGEFSSGTTLGTGFSTSTDVRVLDLNGDGVNDIAALNASNGSVGIFMGNGDGTFVSVQTLASFGTSRRMEIQDINGDGLLDFIRTGTAGSVVVNRGQGGGTFSTTQTYVLPGVTGVAIEDYNSDGVKDMVAVGGGGIYFASGNGDGTFKSVQTITTASFSSSYVNTVSADFNNDGLMDFAAMGENGAASSNARVFLGLGNGSFSQAQTIAGLYGFEIRAGDLNNDGITDIISSRQLSLGNGDGTFKAIQTYNATYAEQAEIHDVNGDGSFDIVAGLFSANAVRVFLNNGDGTFRTGASIAAGSGTEALSFGDLNGDGVADMAVVNLTAGSLQFFTSQTHKSNEVAAVNLRTRGSALEALEIFKSALNQVSAELGQIGAIQSRLSVATNNLFVGRENYQAAGSRIKDTDVANDAAELTRQTILQQSAAAVLSNANQQPRIALRLLQ